MTNHPCSCVTCCTVLSVLYFCIKKNRPAYNLCPWRFGRIGVACRGQVDGVWRQMFHTPQALAFRSVAVYQALPCPGPIFTPRRLIGGYSPLLEVIGDVLKCRSFTCCTVRINGVT